MESSRLALVIFLLLFLFLSPDSGPSLSHQRELASSILEEKHALYILNTSEYGGLDATNNRWLNVTGLRQDDGYAWKSLPKVQARVKEQLQAVLNGLGSPSGEKTNSSGDAGSVPLARGKTIGDELSFTLPFAEPLPLYRNVSGIIHGRWTRSKIEDTVGSTTLNLSKTAPHNYYTSKSYNRNITGSDGDLRIQIKESNELNNNLNSTMDASSVKAQVTIKDKTSSGDGWEATLYGVHYPQQGGIVLSTTSEKFAGIFALPHFTLSKRAYLVAQEYLSPVLFDMITQQEADFTGVLNPWTSSPGSSSEAIFPVPLCELVVYLQQYPVENLDIDLRAIEQELRFPTGASIPAAPSIRMSALIFSPDCGFVLESKGPPEFAPQYGLHLNGQKREVHMREARRYILAFAAIICCQIFLLIRQMKDASTPSTKSRISFFTIAIMALGDGFACMGTMVTSMVIDTAFLPLITLAFLSFLCVSFFGMKFLMDIWAVQTPERVERQRERQRERDRRNAESHASRPPSDAPVTTSAAVITAAGAETLPLPVTAQQPTDSGAVPISITPDQDLDAAQAEDTATAQTAAQTTVGSARRELSALYSKFYFLLIGIIFLSLHATTWPTTLRSIYSNFLALVYLSLWIPQIRRNVLRNCPKALRWEFVIGESVLRLAPIVYFYRVPENILFVDNDANAAYIFIGWVWIQIWALVSQEILGPRFFVPNGYAPPAYDYHPILREDDEESGSTMPIGFTQANADPSSPTVSRPGESKEKGKKVWDCAICTENIELPVLPAAGNGSGEASAAVTTTTIFSRRTYMVTPCRHIFHSQCLEGWMRYRLQCPICRDNLPPL